MIEAELKAESKVTLRPAAPDDAPIMLEMVTALAEYQDQGASMTATVEDFRRNGFGPDRQFECILAEQDGAPVGLAIFFPTYATWDANRGLYIQDLFVAESVRGRGVGISLVQEVAQIAKQRGCGHLQLNVVHANPARNFYDRFGFVHVDDLLTYRLSGERFERLARGKV